MTFRFECSFSRQTVESDFTYEFIVGHNFHFNAEQRSNGLQLRLSKCLMTLGESHEILHGGEQVEYMACFSFSAFRVSNNSWGLVRGMYVKIIDCEWGGTSGRELKFFPRQSLGRRKTQQQPI